MKKTLQSVNQPQSSCKQKQPDQSGVLREGDKLTAEQIKEFLHESRQNSEFSNFDETINNQQKMEKIMIKQNFLEINQLFDPIEYFGGLKVKDLNQKVDDQRLSDMFKIQTEENNTEKSDLVSYHIKNVQQSLIQKNQEQLKNQNWIDKDKQTKAYYFNQNQSSSLLGYSQQQQQQLQANKYTTKSAQSPSYQQQLAKQNSNQSCDKENFSVIKQNSTLQQKGSSFNSPLSTKISQTLQQNYSSFTQIQEPSNSNGMLNITPLKQISQNIQFSSTTQQGQLNNSKMNKKEPELMISPEQITKQKLSQQSNSGNPLIFSFQQNGAVVNTLNVNPDVVKNQYNNIEQSHKVLNNKSALQSNNQTPSKQNHTTKDVKIACIPNDTSPSSHKIVACKPLSQKNEGDFNRIQLLQAVEQINIESQRKNGDSSCSSSVTPKNMTPSNKVIKNDQNKTSISNAFKQENVLNAKNSQISQQYVSLVNGENLSLSNQAKNSHTDKMTINEEISTHNQFLSQQEHQDEVEFYDQSNWQSVQQISQHFQSVENNSNGQFYNTQNAVSKNCNISQMQDGLINIQENVFQQQNNNGFQTLSKSSLHHRSQSKMFEQKQNSEQFFKDKENLELTFQEETVNNEEQQSETEFNCQNLQSSLNQIPHCSPATYTQFKQEIIPSPQNNQEEISHFQNNLYNKIASLHKHNNANQLQNYKKNLGQEQEQQIQQNENPSQNFKKFKEKSKSMIQGELINAANQKSGTNQNQYSSRNNSREIQKKNSYFVQRQMNVGVTTNKLKSFIASNTPQNSIMNGSAKGKAYDNSQLGKFNQSSYNNSKMSSSIMLQEKSLIICDKSQVANISTLQNTNNILQNSNIQEKQSTQSYAQQYQCKQQSANLPSKINQYKKSSSQASCRKDNFLSPKVSQRNTPRSNSQYSSVDYCNTNQSQSTTNAHQSKRGHNKSQPNLCIQPLSNSNIQSNSQSKQNYGIYQNLQNCTTNIINNNLLQNNVSSGVNNYINGALNNATANQLANITSSQNSQMTNGILSSLSSTYLKRPSGKNIQYDYKSITNQANNLSKNRLASSPTHSPNNYKIKQAIVSNSNQTLRQKKLTSRLEQNTSKSNSQALSFRDQQVSHLNIQAPNTGNNSSKINSNQSNLLQSINVNSGKYNPEQFDKDLKYNIAVEAKKAAVFKIDPKYEESLNHLMNMQAKHQTSQSSLYINQNQLSQGNLQQFSTTTVTTPSMYQANNTSNKNQIQNYQK